MADYKQLCGKLADELGKYHARVIEDDGYGSHDTEALLRRADKALAEAEPEELTEEELLNLMPKRFCDNLAASSRALCNIGTENQVAEVKSILTRDSINYVRIAIAADRARRFVPPTNAEVTELVKDLHDQADYGYCDLISNNHLRRAAELLQQYYL